MNTKNYATSLEGKLIEEFKRKFFNKLGYEPVVHVGSRLKTEDGKDVVTMSLGKLKDCFTPFLPLLRGIPLELDNRLRKKDLVELRVIFSFIAKSMGYTLENIRDVLGKKDHTTVIHSITCFKNWVSIDPSFRDKFNIILNYIVVIQNKQNESSTLEHTDQMEHQS
jgi:hypothetical protein